MMTTQPFPQTTITVIWDFDETLIPGSMQKPILEEYKIDEAIFWDEVNALSKYYSARDVTINQSSAYLNHMLTYVKAGKFPGLNNAKLRELGAQIEFFDGVTELFQMLKNEALADSDFQKHQIDVELYVVSAGLSRMIKGSAIAEYIDGIWGCEFIEAAAPPGYLHGEQSELMPSESEISQIGFTIDDTTKTRAIFEINKGVNKHSTVDVNSQIPHENRRVPFNNMVYIADGPSDIPVFSLLNQYGGRTYAVYRPSSKRHFDRVCTLRQQNRIEAYGPADYTQGTQTSMWILKTVQDIASRIVADKESALRSTLGHPPGHIVTASDSQQD